MREKSLPFFCYIGMLDDETKKTFIEYPIYHLYKELT